jgi:nucleoside-diphosphate-sugar epimerase
MSHVIFGTGAVGMAVMDTLVGHGERVRMINRSGAADVPAGVDVLGGDASDPEFARCAAADAAVVYQALNPPYSKWPELFPALQAGVLAGAEAAGAKLVVMENVYGYGRPAGRPFTEDRPLSAHTRKGQVRAQMTETLLEAHRQGRVQVTIGRASDYFGPRGGQQSNLGDRVFVPALEGKTAQVLGDPNMPHTYTYIPDIGSSLVVLGQHDQALGQAWHLPSPAAQPTRELVEIAYRATGKPMRLRAAPKLMVRAIGVVNPIMRELSEMLYEFDEPFIVDSSKFEQAFGVAATPAEEAIAQTVDWYRRSRASSHEPVARDSVGASG